MTAIEIQDLWKSFRLNSQAAPSLLQTIKNFGRAEAIELPVLRGISLTVQRGEKVGLIGKNGAGKTTLLRLINGIYKPDRGAIFSHGRVVAILQLGIGLVGILSVRDNIFLYGTILGLTRQEIREKYEEILLFAELDKFEGAEVRQLSTGMRQRLAFSVAAQVNADIFLLDEALAVGDQMFRNKCYEYLTDRLSSHTTVVYASHSLASLEEYFPNTVWLENGQIAAYDSTSSVLKSYKKKYGRSAEDRFRGQTS